MLRHRRQHGPDVVVRGVVDRREAFDEAVGERWPRRWIIAQPYQQVPRLGLEPVGERLAATTIGYMVDGPKLPTTRRRSARRG